MSHTSLVLPVVAPNHPMPAQVTCRARTWHVLDRRLEGGVTTWRLARDAEMPRLIAAPPDIVVARPQSGRRVSRREWVRLALAHVHASMPVWWPSASARLPIELVPWQFVAAMMMLSGHHRRLLLADDVGMGKTVQAGLLLHEVHAREPDAATLVIVPPALVSQWTSELRARVLLETTVLDAPALRAESSAPQHLVDASRAGNCWLISIDLLRQPDVIALIARTRWTLLVVDEAHACSPASARLEAVSRVALSSARVLLLTACPTASGELGADRLRGIGGRDGERPMPVLRRTSSRLTRTPRRTRVLRVALGADHLALCARLDEFAARAWRESGTPGLLPALVLRRRAACCPVALVRSIERRLTVLGTHAEAEPVPASLFDVGVDELDDERAMRTRAWRSDPDERTELEALLRLARRLPQAGARLAAVARLVRRCAEPVVIFTTYLDSLRALHPLIADLPSVFIHGEQPGPLREAAIEAFTRGQATVLLTTDASAEGLNLHQRCRLVVHAEVPGSRRTFEQRNGRVDRYGQTRRVHAVVMASATTEDIDALSRLEARSARDEHWIASMQPRRCRRTDLAARVNDDWRTTASRRAQCEIARGSVSVPVCRLRGRRWHRLGTRLQLPASSRSLWIATVRASGGAELSTTRSPVCVATRDSSWPSFVDPSAWPAPLRSIAIRAGRLAGRLERWDGDAAHEALRVATAAGRDLFSDATARPVAERCRTQRQPVSLSLEPLAAIVGAHAGQRDVDDSNGVGGDPLDQDARS